MAKRLIITVVLLVASEAGLVLIAKQPVTACAEVKCAPISCVSSFHVKTDGGSCCPVCWSDEVVVAEDRTRTEN